MANGVSRLKTYIDITYPHNILYIWLLHHVSEATVVPPISECVHPSLSGTPAGKPRGTHGLTEAALHPRNVTAWSCRDTVDRRSWCCVSHVPAGAPIFLQPPTPPHQLSCTCFTFQPKAKGVRATGVPLLLVGPAAGCTVGWFLGLCAALFYFCLFYSEYFAHFIALSRQRSQSM